jgi:DNA end-binding protein Ku
VAEQEDDVTPRSFWSGTITFGLVSIPVELFPASRSQRVSLRMVSPDGTPLVRRYFCPAENRELEWDEIVRGYEVEKDRFIVVTDDELEKLAPEKTRDIDLRRFVNADEIDPVHFERAYYLTPGGNSTKAYRLLAATMEQTGKAGIATFVMRGKEYLIAILAENGILRAETLRFADEVRNPDDAGLPAPQKPKPARVREIEKAIVALTRKKFEEAELADHASERLLELVARKEKRGEDVVQAPEGASSSPSEGVIDLMEVLKRSLQGNAHAGGDGGTRKPAAKKTAAKQKSAPKKSAARKSTSRKSPPGKTAGKKSAGKTSAKKSSAKKSAASKTPSKGTAAKKSSARKSAPGKSAPGKSAAKKKVAGKPARRRSA